MRRLGKKYYCRETEPKKQFLRKQLTAYLLLPVLQSFSSYAQWQDPLSWWFLSRWLTDEKPISCPFRAPDLRRTGVRTSVRLFQDALLTPMPKHIDAAKRWKRITEEKSLFILLSAVWTRRIIREIVLAFCSSWHHWNDVKWHSRQTLSGTNGGYTSIKQIIPTKLRTNSRVSK